jgi:hypothetical protein
MRLDNNSTNRVRVKQRYARIALVFGSAYNLVVSVASVKAQSSQKRQPVSTHLCMLDALLDHSRPPGSNPVWRLKSMMPSPIH